MDWKNSEPPRSARVLYAPDVQCTWVGVKPVQAGLINVGNTCFLNSVLQALFHLPSFITFLNDDKNHRLKCFSLLKCLKCSLHRTYLNMSIHSTFRPVGLINILPSINPLLKRGRQEDADEFLVSLLGKVQEDLIEREGGPKALDYCSQQTTAIGKIFGWWAQSSKKCVDYGLSSDTYEPLSSLHVPLSPSIQGAVNELLHPIESPREDYQCSKKCPTKAAYENLKFYTYPKVLKLGLKRFDNKGLKIHTSINIERTVVIKDAEYKFVSAILHQGEFSTTGHYTCLVIRPDGKAVFLNDSKVSEAKGRTGLESQQVKSSVYILFYQLHYLKVHSVKRGPPITPSKALSPLRKKVHVSPHKKSMEKKKKLFTFSPKKYKRKLGNMIHSILPLKFRKNEGGKDTLAKPLVDKEDTCSLQPALVPSAEPRVEPITMQRRSRLIPPSTASQSENEYAIIKKAEKTVQPLIIHRRHKVVPPSSSSQSSNDYFLDQKDPNLCEDDKDSEATAEAKVTPRKISKAALEKASNDNNDLACTEELPPTPENQSYLEALRDHDYATVELEPLCDPSYPQCEESDFLGTDFHDVFFDMNNNNPPQSSFEKEYWDECFAKTTRGIHPLCGHVSTGKKGVIGSIEPVQITPADIPPEELPPPESTEPQFVPVKITPADIPREELPPPESSQPQFVPVKITPADVPGAELPQVVLEKNSVGDLRTWLKLRNIPTKGNKTQLINKVKNCIAMGKDSILDPKIGGGKIYNEKRKGLMLSQDVAHLSDDEVFPHSGWAPFPSRDMPTNYNFGSVHHYLVETMPGLGDILNSDEDSSDDEALEVIHIADPFEEDERIEIKFSKKLRRGLQYVKSGFVHNVHDCLPDELHCYKGQIRAPMKQRAYSVKLCISQMSGFILKCACDDICPQGTLGRCSHISALLLHLLIHKSLNGPCGSGGGRKF